ncbi:glycosyltransferase family 4 protein [Acidithiobacillus thiooxidans]|uniref:N, N'-diacetylbacillosaminyl-diphospho-undecaprenol alpha-1,3-N-acetylgalactosaminyltransferase n=1 Tax=Acidithiobacillus thiooxidans ATCC 19377 TaxID=637390 RepID=A0A543Q4E0_ACITH|nr:glycosyltransferase family 4 protein [Acidithiobacillus thiooxidans]MDX5934678.1 glycosyltransferase family 4 protein [Acidithiobacillus thiooxidans]TQN51199.1 N,N'-diacetylbacillosaminyl-diphospho-undecaprenol alpha-1,3-N-acetylgalactosaminyltransferase [Acidithiobacillus thiooxidans ATCC 19377]
MKKLCLVTHKLKKGDGQGRVNYEIVRAACTKGYDVTILATECARDVIEDFGVHFIEIQVDPWKTNLIRNQIFALKSYIWLKNYGSQFDILNVNGFITWFPAQVNSVHFVHGAWMRSPYNVDRIFSGIKSAYYKIFTIINSVLEKRAFKQANIVVAVSPLVVEELITIGVPKHKIIMIPNGVDIEEFHPGEGLRTELGFRADTPLAIFSGDLRSRRKNLETVLAALRDCADWHLLVLSRVEGSIYPAMAQEMGILNRVHFLGFRSDSAALMRTADVLIFPSRYDPCTLVVAEALASGVPVITAKSVGASFQITQDSGWIMDDPENHRKITEILQIILSEKMSGNNIRKDQARFAALKYSWDITANNYLELYQKIIKTNTDVPSTISQKIN